LGFQRLVNANKIVRFLLLNLLLFFSCQKETSKSSTGGVTFLILAPGHFHAALIQKTMYDRVSTDVYVYETPGPELEDYLSRVDGYNNRQHNPTCWNELVYQGNDFLDKMIQEKKGNVVVISGNNRQKTWYIKSSVETGLNVLSDKPMCIDRPGFDLLQEAFALAAENRVLLYDIMTERYEITTILQKELAAIPEVFGGFETGTPENPAVTKESVHHFFKYVSGVPIKRPAWYFDELQQGEGIVDVTTHLVDLVQWECFPEEIIDYNADIEMISARRWATWIDRTQFMQVTGLLEYPDYLKVKTNPMGAFPVFSNGEMTYRLKGIYVKISVIWNFEAESGGGDTHLSIFRGRNVNLIIRQGPQQQFRPELYVEVVETDRKSVVESTLNRAIEHLQNKYPGIGLVPVDTGWRLIIPDQYRLGHEAHFGQVTEKYLQFLQEGKLPAWEVPNMLAKYYITTTAREMALKNSQ